MHSADPTNPYEPSQVGFDDRPEPLPLPRDGKISLYAANSAETLTRGAALAARGSWRPLMTQLYSEWIRVAIIVLGIAAVVEYHRNEPFYTLVCAVMAVAGALLYWSNYLAQRRVWNQYRRVIKDRYADYTQYFAADGHHYESPSISGYAGWARYDGYRASRDVLVLYHDFPDNYEVFAPDKLLVPELFPALVKLVGEHVELR